MKRQQVSFRRGFAVLLGNRQSQAAEMVLAAGAQEGGSDNRHCGADQWLFVVSGSGTATVNGRIHRLRPGTLLLIKSGDRHQITNTSRKRQLQTLNLYVPPAYTPRGVELPRGKR